MDGFCPNEVPLIVGISENDPTYTKKLEFWSRGEPNHDATKRVRICVSSNENTRLLFSLLRTLACNEEELVAVSTSMDGTVVSRALFGMTSPHHHATNFYRSCRDIRHPLTLRNERAALLLLMKFVQEALNKYPTTLSQDETDLLDEGAYPQFSNRRHAKIQVRGEKHVLHHYHEWSKAALHVMNVMQDELDSNEGGLSFEQVVRQMEDDDNFHHTIVRYCVDVLGSLQREELKERRRKALNQSSC